MFCSNCGSPLKTGDKFCQQCGTPVSGNPTYTSGPIKTPPTKKRGLPIIPIIAVLLVVLGGAAAFSQTSLFRKAFSSPEKYFQYCEQKALKETINDTTEAYDTAFAPFKEDSINNSIQLDLSLGQYVLDLLEQELPGYDLSGIKTLNTRMMSNITDETISSSVTVGLNDVDITSADFVLQDSSAYLRFPELASTWLSTSAYELSISSQTTKLVLDALKKSPDSKVVQTLMDRYGSMIIEDVNKVVKEDDTLSVNDVSQDCTKLTATIDSATARTMANHLLEAVKDDKEIEAILTDYEDIYAQFNSYYSISGDLSLKQVFHMGVDYALDELKEIEDYNSNNQLIYSIWVDNKGNIVGRQLFADDEEIFSIYRPVSGKNFRMDARIDDLTITGEGTESDTVSGNYEFVASGMSLLSVELSDVDAKKARQGKPNGTIHLTPGHALLSSNYTLREYSYMNPAISIEFVGKDGKEGNMSFLSNGSEVFSSHFKQSNDAYLHLNPQGDRVYEYSNYSDDALSYYVQEINMSPLKENIYNANLGSYITEALIEYIETLEYQLR